MRVFHRVTFPGGNNYEQYAAEFELTTEDISGKLLDNCNLLEQMFVFDTIVCYQGLLFQYLKGYIDKKLLDGQSKRLFSMLTPKLEGMVKEILKSGGEKKKETKKSGGNNKKKSG